METKKFQRKKEDFICENCKTKVKGDGYTNHCPNCLWSKHVDENPGDRASSCKGLMAPVMAEIASKNYIITHECKKCGVLKRNKTKKEDNVEKIIKLV